MKYHPMEYHMPLMESVWAHMKLLAWEEPHPVSLLLIEPYSGYAGDITRALPFGEPLYAFTVTRKKSLKDALDFLKTSHVDIVLMDLNVPGGATVEAVDAVHGLFPELPIILLDDRFTMETVHQVLQHGAQQCLARGECDSVTLRQSIADAIARKQREMSYLRGEKL